MCSTGSRGGACAVAGVKKNDDEVSRRAFGSGGDGHDERGCGKGGAVVGEGATCESGGAMRGERGVGAARRGRWPMSGVATGEAQRRWWLGLERWRHDVWREKDERGQEKRKRVGPHVSVRF